MEPSSTTTDLFRSACLRKQAVDGSTHHTRPVVGGDNHRYSRLIVRHRVIHEPAVTHPLVSIITPSFNQAAFLPATLDSVLSQDYDHLELIVMDGGSTDGSVAILEAQTDPRLTWISESDRGQSHALNKGLARAQGEILTYLNSDDLIMPHTLAFIVDYFEAHPDSGSCFSATVPILMSMGNHFKIVKGIPLTFTTALTAAATRTASARCVLATAGYRAHWRF